MQKVLEDTSRTNVLLRLKVDLTTLKDTFLADHRVGTSTLLQQEEAFLKEHAIILFRLHLFLGCATSPVSNHFLAVSLLEARNPTRERKRERERERER